ncbi:SDR family oxidoreductase [Amycolatopsis ultiminotia]|uniref:SDR family oxidoreductase n=1 Tax=Amycolatopsis ultiminotia TaxID=543629 RepID=A0ABP6YKT0_9PSEU
MPASLKNRKVLVIGRGSGIAQAITLSILDVGGTVVAAGRDPGALTAAHSGSHVTVERVDLTDEASVAALAARSGTVDHVVSTASARARGTAADLGHDTVLNSFDTKVVGPILLAKHFAPRMPEDGSFVFFSGASARKPMPGMLAVGATNAAVDALTRGLAVELAPIRVNAVSPGTIDTGAYDGLGDRRKAELFAARAAGSPARRIGRSDEVADAVLFALTSTFTTGVALSVDGGESLV